MALSSSGSALIQVNIPATATQNPVITFTVISANSTYVYQQTLNVVLGTQPVIDFFPATGYLTANIPNQIYFQAWTDSSKTQTFEITGASLRQVISKTSTVLLLNQTISTSANGKGSFYFTPTSIAGAQNPTFEFSFQGLNLVRDLTFSPNLFQNTIYSEAQISILNSNRSLANNENLQFQITTNSSINVSETYIVQIRNGE